MTLATVMYEILLTRIFSVTMWYHFAFAAISMAMFGLAIGGLVVLLRPGSFAPGRAPEQLALSSLAFSLTIVASFVVYLQFGSVPNASVRGLVGLASTYVISSVPFVFGGITTCHALTAFPGQVGRLYAADLAGAALGGALLVSVLEFLDGPSTVFVVAALAGLGVIAFATAAGGRCRAVMMLAGTLVVAVAPAAGLAAVWGTPLVRLVWVKGHLESPPLYERWNSFSRVQVVPWFSQPFGWGLSPTYRSGRSVRQLWLHIDGDAGTPLTAFDGNLEPLDYLRYDLVNLAHYLKRQATVLVVGVGGGRDVLSALVFDQAAVTGVELNGNVLAALNRRFADFTGHLDRHPRVRFVQDEARSYLARHRTQFDIIQASLTDTWAATAAGAYVLAENALYTLEAWRVFLQRLAPGGILTFSRWYIRDAPYEAYRLTALARAALLDRGIDRPRQHIVLIRHLWPGAQRRFGIGTILVKNEAFSEADLDTIDRVCRQMGFEVMVSPRSAPDPVLSAVVTGADSVIDRLPFDLAVPTDDRPFFFHVVRFRDAFWPHLWAAGPARHSVEPVLVLAALLAIVTGLALLGLVFPLAVATGRAAVRGAASLAVFFAAIGAGFMFVEISQLQRLIIFLGHPTYGLSVVLFALLVGSGAGSCATQRVEALGFSRSALTRLGLLLAVLVLYGQLSPVVTEVFRGAVTPFRMAVAVLLLLPPGFFMGMAFPLGMRLAATRSPASTPWLWGINGAMSVCASVLAVAVALSAGIRTVFWAGTFAYGVALLAFGWTGWSSRRSPGRARDAGPGGRTDSAS